MAQLSKVEPHGSPVEQAAKVSDEEAAAGEILRIG